MPEAPGKKLITCRVDSLSRGGSAFFVASLLIVAKSESDSNPYRVADADAD